MVQFSINPEEISVQVNEEKEYVKELAEIRQEVRSIEKDIRFEILSKSQIQSRLSTVCGKLEEQEAGVQSLHTVLQNIMETYENTEKRILQNLGTQIGVKAVNLADGAADWYKKFKTAKSFIEDVVEEYTFQKPKLLPDRIEEVFGMLSKGETFMEIINEVKKYRESGDGMGAYVNIAGIVYENVIKEGFKWLDKRDNLKYIGTDKAVQNILTDIIIEMPQKWIQELKDFNGDKTSGQIWVDTVFGTISGAVASAAQPYYTAATWALYPAADKVCEAFGYDLSGEYEKMTGKSGLDAVFAAQKELWVDIVYEGAKTELAQGVDNFYDTAGKAWNCWKSGIQTIFG